MSFQTEVEGLTSLSVGTTPTTTELSTFLKDGVIDVTNRWLLVRPQDIELFARESDEQISNTTSPLDLNGAKIISVIRENGTDSQWRECRKISPALQYDVTDVESLNYASKINPVYMVGNDGRISVFPIPGATTDAFKVYYVNNDPVDKTATPVALDQDDTAIGFFPDDKVYLVVIYASMKSLMAKLTSLNNSLPSDITLPSLPVQPAMNTTTLSIPSFTAPDAFVQPVMPAGANIDFSSVPSAPTYTAPVLTLGTTPTISNLTISSTPPVAPSSPSFSTPTIGTVTVASTTLSNIGTPPVYTAPKVGSATEELTATMEAPSSGTTYGTDADFLDFSRWFNIAGELIEDEEDVELAQAHLQKISAYIQAYSGAMQNQLNIFNDANAEYQGKLQEGIQQAQINAQKAQAQAQLDATDQQQSASLLLQKENQEYAVSLQKYSAEVQAYQANVAKEVQEYQQNLAGDIQVWQAERTTDLQKYGSDIQNETSRVTNDMKTYQAEIGKAVQQYQAETGYDMSIYQTEIQATTAKFTNDLGKNNATFQADLGKFTADLKETQQENQEKITLYSAEIQEYNAELAGKVQEFKTSLEKDSADYQWTTAQYAALKAEYDQAFMIAAPQQQAAPEAARQRR